MEDSGIRVFPHTMCAGLYFSACVFVRSYKQLRECSDKDKEGKNTFPILGLRDNEVFVQLLYLTLAV